MNDTAKAMKCFDKDDLIMSSVAHYLRCDSSLVDDFCARLVKAWPHLNLGVQKYIKEIVEHKFGIQEALQTLDVEYNPFGDAGRRESWCEVRKCWAEEQEKPAF